MSTDVARLDERGLSTDEVFERMSRGAVNRVKDRTSRSVASIIRENVLTLFNAIIVGASISSCCSVTCATVFSAALWSSTR